VASWWLSTRFLEIRFLYPWLVWGTWRIATVPWCTQTDNLRTGQLLCRLPVNVCNTVRTQYQDVESSWIWTKRPYSKGTRLLFEIIAAIIIIQVHCDVDQRIFQLAGLFSQVQGNLVSLGLFCGKWPTKTRHTMGLRHPIHMVMIAFIQLLLLQKVIQYP